MNPDFSVIRFRFLLAGFVGLFFVIGFLRWVVSHV